MDNSQGLGSLVDQGVLSRDLDKNNVMIGQEQPFYQSKGMAIPAELQSLLQAYRTTQQEVKKPQGNPAPTTVKEDIMGMGQPQMPQSPMGQAPMGQPPAMPNPREQGIAGLPQKAVGTKGFAAGGIVAFAEGGDPAQAAAGAIDEAEAEAQAAARRAEQRIAAGEARATAEAAEEAALSPKAKGFWSRAKDFAKPSPGIQRGLGTVKKFAVPAATKYLGTVGPLAAISTASELGGTDTEEIKKYYQNRYGIVPSKDPSFLGDVGYRTAAAAHDVISNLALGLPESPLDREDRAAVTPPAVTAKPTAPLAPEDMAGLQALLAKMPKPNTGGGGGGATLPNFSIPRTAQADPYAGVAGKIRADADRDTKSRVAERRKWDEEAGITGNEADYLASIEAKRGKLSKEEEKAKWLDMAGRFADAGGQRNWRQAGLKILGGVAGAEAESGKRIKAANEAFDEATRKSKEATALRARGDYAEANKAQAEADKAMLEVTKAQAEYSQKDRQQEQQARIGEGQINTDRERNRIQAARDAREVNLKGTESDLAEYRALDKIIMSSTASPSVKAAAKANQTVILDRIRKFSLAGGADTLAAVEARSRVDPMGGIGGSPAISAIDAELAKRGK